VITQIAPRSRDSSSSPSYSAGMNTVSTDYVTVITHQLLRDNSVSE
jgi:hypothetical protein